MSAEDAFCNGFWVKVFDFWFYLMEKVRFSLFVSVMYRDHEASVTYIALFFDRTDGIPGISRLQKTYLSWQELKLVKAMGTADKNGLFLFFREEAENTHGRFPPVSG